MSSFLDNIGSYLDTNNAEIIFDADAGRNTFTEFPPEPDTCIVLLGLVGSTLSQSRDVKGLQFPRFQVYVRSKNYETAADLMAKVRNTLHGMIGVNLANYRVLRCHAEQDGGPIGQDEQGRHEFSINMIAEHHAL